MPGARAMDAIATDRLSSENMTYDLLGTTNFPQATLLEGDQSTANTSSSSRSLSPKPGQSDRQSASSRYESIADQEQDGERFDDDTLKLQPGGGGIKPIGMSTQGRYGSHVNFYNRRSQDDTTTQFVADTPGLFRPVSTGPVRIRATGC